MFVHVRRVPRGGRGISSASPRRISAITVRVPNDAAYGLPPGYAAATRIEPTRAVPSDEPRFDTLRDSPEMSLWSRSGKLDWTMLTDEVSITPTPRPMHRSPGTELSTPDCGRTSAS